MSLDKVFTKFKDPVNSYPLGEMNVGPMRPGRYSGFDILSSVVGLDIRIDHSDFITKSSGNLEDTITVTQFGSILMPNGSIIHNEATVVDSQIGQGIPLTIESNIGNGNTRVDYIICQHEYVQIIGGQPPIYQVIKGPDNGEDPVIPNPEKQVLLGKMYITPGGYLFGDLDYEPEITNLPGDLTYQQIYDILISYFPPASGDQAGMVQFASAAEVIARAVTDKVLSPASILNMVATDSLLGLTKAASDAQARNGLTTGDISFITPELMRLWGRRRDLILYDTNIAHALDDDWNGRVVSLNGNPGTATLINITVPAALALGFHTEILSYTQKVKFLAGAGGVTFVLPPNKTPQSKYLGNALRIINVGVADKYMFDGEMIDTIPAGAGIIPIGGAIDFYPPTNDLSYFDGTGLGTHESVIGFAIQNSQNGTRDLRGRNAVGYNPSDADYSTLFATGGSKKTTMLRSDLPNVKLKAFASDNVSTTDDILANFPNRTPSTRAGNDNSYIMGGSTNNPTLGAIESMNGDITQTQMENRQPYIVSVKIQRIA